MLSDILRSPQFDQDGAAIAGSLQRWDEALLGLEWILARSPAYYPETHPAGVRTAHTHAGLLGRRIRVHYRVLDANRVELLRAF